MIHVFSSKIYAEALFFIERSERLMSNFLFFSVISCKKWSLSAIKRENIKREKLEMMEVFGETCEINFSLRIVGIFRVYFWRSPRDTRRLAAKHLTANQIHFSVSSFLNFTTNRAYPTFTIFYNFTKSLTKNCLQFFKLIFKFFKN